MPLAVVPFNVNGVSTSFKLTLTLEIVACLKALIPVAVKEGTDLFLTKY